MSQGLYHLQKHGFMLQQIKVLTWKKKKKKPQKCYLWIQSIKHFFPSNCTWVRHSLQKQKVLFQLALNLCILVSQGIGCLSRYWWQLMKISTEAVSRDASERIHWNWYSVATPACKPETLYLNIFSSLGTTVLGKVTMLFLIKDNSYYLTIRKPLSWINVFHLMNKVIKNINRVLLLSFKNTWSKIWKYISNNKVKMHALEK